MNNERLKLNRRQCLATATAAAVAAAAPQILNAQGRAATGQRSGGNPAVPTYPYQLPELPYAYDALEPHIDSQTMRIHHTKHHQGYVDKLNAALKEHSELQQMPLEQLLSKVGSLPESVQTAVRNNGGGHANHSLFWAIMAPPNQNAAGGQPSGRLAEAINAAFGSTAKLQEQFNAAGGSVFGSGWVWVAVDPQSGKLSIATTPNQDSLYMDGKGTIPLFGADVWEHAYYLKYQNQRAEYLKAFWNVVNWQGIDKRYNAIAGA